MRSCLPLLVVISFIFLYAPAVAQADTSMVPGKKKGVFSLGLHYYNILNSLEKFDALGNEAILSKKNFGGTSSYDRNGIPNKQVNNYFIEASLMYRILGTNENTWGFEAGIGKGNVAAVYHNLVPFDWLPAGGVIDAWVNSHNFSQYSLAVNRSYGSGVYSKWYWKCKASLLTLKSVDKNTADFETQWINGDKNGGIWEGRFLNRKSITLMPEAGLQWALGENRNTLVQVGLGWQIGMKNLYSEQYYSVGNGIKTSTNKITTKGNFWSLNFSAYVPLLVVRERPKTERIKPRKPEKPGPVAREYTQNNLVFLVDVSVSMNAEDKLVLLKQYIVNMLDSLPPDDYITIITFSGSAAVILQPTQVKDRDKIEEKLQNLTVHGNTDINRGLEKAYEILNKNHIYEGNNRIIMATDGEFRASPKTKELIKSNFESKRKIVLSVFHFTGNTGKESSPLGELAALGGGNYSTVNKDNINSKLEGEYRQKTK